MKKKKMTFSKKIIPVIIFAIMAYTIASFALQFYNGAEISPTLTTAYFGFWTIEIISLATIKSTKVRRSGSEYAETNRNKDTEEGEE